MKDVTIVLADSAVHFKIRSKFFIEITNNELVRASVDPESDRRHIGSNGLLLQPGVWYKFVFVADDFSFTENEELSVRPG